MTAPPGGGVPAGLPFAPWLWLSIAIGGAAMGPAGAWLATIAWLVAYG